MIVKAFAGVGALTLLIIVLFIAYSVYEWISDFLKMKDVIYRNSGKISYIEKDLERIESLYLNLKILFEEKIKK